MSGGFSGFLPSNIFSFSKASLNPLKSKETFDKYSGMAADPSGILGKEAADVLADPSGLLGKTRRERAKATALTEMKQSLEISKQNKALAKEETERKKRITRPAQGRRGLLWAKTGELGVQSGLQKATKLGG